MRKDFRTDADRHDHRRWHRRSSGSGRRYFARGEVKYALLGLLQAGPMHGYQMMKELEALTDGAYVPSAGSIYPTLQMLVDQELLAMDEQDGKKSYSITPAGLAFWSDHMQQLKQREDEEQAGEDGGRQHRDHRHGREHGHECEPRHRHGREYGQEYGRAHDEAYRDGGSHLAEERHGQWREQRYERSNGEFGRSAAPCHPALLRIEALAAAVQTASPEHGERLDAILAEAEAQLRLLLASPGQ